MKKLKILICLLFIIGLNYNSLGQDGFVSSGMSPDKLTEVLAEGQSWVPYPSYYDREGWDQLTAGNKNSIIRRGEKFLGFDWKVIKATDYFEYERTGNRDIMQVPDRQNTDALTSLVMAELAEGEGRFIDEIINGVFFQCERTSWVLSAHLFRQPRGRALPDHEKQIIDLKSGDIGGFLAWTYYFLNKEFDKVHPFISERLHKELYDRIIIPYRVDDDYWWMAFKLKPDDNVNNWNPWCNFNVLQTVLLLENDQTKRAQDVYKTMQSVDKFVDFVSKDGACEEGPSYWGHAAGKLYDYLRVLYLGSEGRLDYFKDPLMKKMGEYMPHSYVGSDWVVNFADASPKFSSNAGLIYRYGDAVGSEEMKGFASYLISKGKPAVSYGLDIFRTFESLAYSDAIAKQDTNYKTGNITEYPETQFYYLKNKEGMFLAAKGGHNSESHNHNDIGTFSLYYNDTPLFIDAGVGTYTRQTFSHERYSIWTMRSIYHNLPSVNGTEQQHGREFKAKNVNFNGKQGSLSIDISGAYPADASIKYWNRAYKLKGKELTVTDSYELSAYNAPNEIHFLLWGDIDISSPGLVTIAVDKIAATMNYDKNRFDPSLETIELTDPKLSNVWGEKIYRLTLKDKQPGALKGKYEFVIKAK